MHDSEMPRDRPAEIEMTEENRSEATGLFRLGSRVEEAAGLVVQVFKAIAHAKTSTTKRGQAERPAVL